MISEAAHFLLDARRALDTIRAAETVGLLAALERMPGDASSLATRCEVPPDRMHRLLAALGTLGVVESRQGTWTSRVPSGAMRALLREPDLGEALRVGPALDAAIPEGSSALYRFGAPLLAHLMAAAAAELAPHLAGFGPRTLELGAGAMPWGLALGGDRELTGLDLPAVVDAVREQVAARADVAWIEGDLFTVPLPRDHFDLVLVPNLLHLFSVARCERLLARAAAVTRSGGAVAVVDTMPAEDEAADRTRSLYDLSLAGRTGEGRVYTDREVRGWLEAAGLSPGVRARTEARPHMDLLVAIRP